MSQKSMVFQSTAASRAKTFFHEYFYGREETMKSIAEYLWENGLAITAVIVFVLMLLANAKAFDWGIALVAIIVYCIGYSILSWIFLEKWSGLTGLVSGAGTLLVLLGTFATFCLVITNVVLYYLKWQLIALVNAEAVIVIWIASLIIGGIILWMREGTTAQVLR